MINVKTPGSPGWRLQRLAKKLESRQQAAEPLYARYEGNAPLPEHMVDAPDAAQKFFRASRTGFAEMVVRAVKYPLKLQSIATAQDRSDTGDEVAYDLFVASGMRGEIDDVHRNSLVTGNGYAMVSVYEGEPAYTAEDPRQVVTMHDPVRQSIVTEALKLFHHPDDQRDYAYMWRRDGKDSLPMMWRASRPNRPGMNTRFSPSTWSWDDEYGGEAGVRRPSGVPGRVPILRYRDEEGVGEFQRHVPLLERIDHMVLQGMVIATLQAFRQRAIRVPAGDMPDEDEDGNEIDYNEVLSADPGALWKLPETAELWESGQVDLTPIWTGLDKFTQQLSAVTFTSLAQFSPDGQNQSAAGAEYARQGQTDKITDRQERYGEVHALAVSMLFLLAGDAERANLSRVVPQWRPPQRYSLVDRAQALVQFKAGEVPWRTRMIEAGQFTPAQVARMEIERMSDQVLFPGEVSLTAAQV